MNFFGAHVGSYTVSPSHMKYMRRSMHRRTVLGLGRGIKRSRRDGDLAQRVVSAPPDPAEHRETPLFGPSSGVFFFFLAVSAQPN